MTDAELQELAELEELERLEASLGAEQPKERTSALQAIAGGATQGASFGYAPEIAAGVASGVGKLLDYFKPIIDPATGKAIPRVDYESAKKSASQALTQAAEDRPVAYYGANIAGAAAPMAAIAGAAPVARALKAAPVKTGAALGAAQGAVQNPGESGSALDRAYQAAIGGGLGATAGGLGALMRRGAQTAKDIGTIKSGEMSNVAKREIDAALRAIDEQQIAPRSAALRQAISGDEFNVNPERVKGVFPTLAKAMAKKADPATGRVELSPERALRLKRAADQAAGYARSKPFDPAATAKVDEAKSLADILRAQVNANPEAATLNQEMADIFAKRAALAEPARTAPISAIRARPGTDKDSLVKTIDKLAGSNLEGLDERIGRAKDLLLDPANLVKPLEAPNEIRKAILRGMYEASRAAPVKPSSGALPLSVILEAERRNK